MQAHVQAELGVELAEQLPVELHDVLSLGVIDLLRLRRPSSWRWGLDRIVCIVRCIVRILLACSLLQLVVLEDAAEALVSLLADDQDALPFVESLGLFFLRQFILSLGASRSLLVPAHLDPWGECYHLRNAGAFEARSCSRLLLIIWARSLWIECVRECQRLLRKSLTVSSHSPIVHSSP